MSRVHLGRVGVRSGALFLVDEAAAGLFLSNEPDPEAGLVDLVLTGPDAEAAGRTFDRDWDPTRIHDVTKEDVDDLAAAFIAHAHRQGLDASARVDAEVEPFRARLDKALARGFGGGVSFVGHWAAALGKLKDGTAEVWAEPMHEGPDGGRWQRVVVEFEPDAVAERSEEIAKITSESGRVLLGDPEVLSHWLHHESLDGRGDCVFWGRDATVAAQTLDAGGLESRAFGWVNLPVDESLRLAQKVDSERRERGLALSVDFRPHSHHFRMMEHIRESPVGAGEITLDGQPVLAFDGTWGEGVFSIVRESAEDGRTLRLRIELADEAAPTVH